MADVLGKNNYDKMPQIDGVDIVPSGGTAGQALIKDTGTDYDYSWGDVSATLEGLTDTTITTPTNGEYLKYNGSAWVNATIATTLDGLTDTNITSVAAGELLKWDGANWINNTLAEAGVAAASHNHDSTYIDVTGDIAGDQFPRD